MRADKRDAEGLSLDDQPDLFAVPHDLCLVQALLADLHDDLLGKISRYRQIMDLSTALGVEGTMMPGGEVAFNAWLEARTSFIHGNYIATVMLCQGLAEQLLAAQLALGASGKQLPPRIAFKETLRRCVTQQLISQGDADDLARLMSLRNPLSHYRDINDPANLTRRTIDTQFSAETHLREDAGFAISMAVRLLALPAFRLDR